MPIRRQLASYARLRHRDDLAPLIAHPSAEREQRARAVRDAIEKLQELPLPAPMVAGAVDRWPQRRPHETIAVQGLGVGSSLMDTIVIDTGAGSRRDHRAYMDAPYAKLSIRGSLKIAPVHPDFAAALLAPRSLMGFADWLLHR